MSLTLPVYRGVVQESGTSSRLEGVRVRVVGMRRGKPVGSVDALTGPQGQFTLALDSLFQGSATERPSSLRVELWQGSSQLSLEAGTASFRLGSVPSDVALEVAATAAATLPNDPVGTPASVPCVVGVVRSPDGSPIVDRRVRLFKYQLGGPIELNAQADVRTDANGAYEHSGDASLRTPWDIFIRVVDPVANPEVVLGVSQLLHEAPAEARIDLVVSARKQRPPSQYQKVVSRLQGPLGPQGNWTQQTFDALSGDDIVYLADKARLPVRTVSDFVASRRLQARTGVSNPEVTYALVKTLGTAVPQWILNQESGQVETLLQEAADQNLVDKQVGVDKATHAATLSAQRQTFQFDTNRPRSLGTLLNPVGLTAGQKSSLMQAMKNHPHDRGAFWGALRADTANFTGPQVDDIQKCLQLAVLTVSHAPLVHAVRSATAGQPLGVVATWDQAAWLNHINTTDVPKGIPGTNATERRNNYAQAMVEMSELAFPSERAVFDLRNVGSANRQAFMANTGGPFDFRHTHIHAGTVGHLGLPPNERDQLVGELRALQRVFKLAPRLQRGNAMHQLVSHGLTSATKIRRMGKGRLRALIGNQVGAATVDQIFTNAQRLSAVAQMLYTTHHPNVWGPATLVSASPPDPEAAGGENPTYPQIYGSASGCSCDSCLSMFSPAAYFTELLSFLDERGGLTDLFSRRDDLRTLKLTCKNTYTTLPYIDLVLEVLENHPTVRGASPAMPYDMTTADESSLLATPEHFNPAGYGMLRTATLAPSLPYDLWQDHIRTFLGHLGIDRRDLMLALQLRGVFPWVPTDQVRHVEQLGLNDTARAVIDGTALPDPWLLWGYSANSVPEATPWYSDLLVVSHLRDRGGLTIDEILDLLHVMDTGGDALSWPSDASCDLDEITLEGSSPGVAATVFTAWARFLRLMRATGWSALDLRVVLDAFGGMTSLDTTCFEKVSQVHRLVERTGLPPRSIAAFFQLLDDLPDRATREEPLQSEYARVFLHPSLVTAGDASPFEGVPTPDSEGPNLAGDHHAHLQAALGVDATELTGVLAWVSEQVVMGPVRLNRTHLSHVFRRTALAHAAGLTIADLRALVTFAQVDPFQGPQQALSFLDRARDLAASPLSVQDLRALAAHRGPGVTTPTYDDSALYEMVDQIRSDLKALGASFADVIPDQGPAAEAAVVARIQATMGWSDEALLALSNVPGSVTKLNGVAFNFPKYFSCFLAEGFFDSTEEIGRTSTNEAIQIACGLADKLGKLAGLVEVLGFDDDVIVWWWQHVDGTPVPARPLPMPNPWACVANRMVEPLSSAAQAAQWLTDLASLARWLQRASGQTPSDGELLTTLETGDVARIVSDLVTRTGWAEDVVNGLLGNAQIGYLPPGTHNLAELHRFLDAVDLVQRAGTPVSTMLRWTTTAPTRQDADTVIAAVRARYDSVDSWAAAARPLRDQTRQRRRDALVTFLLRKVEGVEDVDALYEHLLIDVAMEPCFLTSRMVQATLSVQQFIGRWLLGLEAPAGAGALTRDDQVQWEWMKQYRVWEAALKLFVYPENWVEPELRQDRTPAFEQLQKALGHGELSEENVEHAVLEYLDAMVDVADLRVLALYVHEDAEEGSNDIHFIARTRMDPPT